jgi:hypothetical protein
VPWDRDTGEQDMAAALTQYEPWELIPNFSDETTSLLFRLQEDVPKHVEE